MNRRRSALNFSGELGDHFTADLAGVPSGDQPHLFGDTKFRSVDYCLRATTAFREYFPAAVTADAKNITRDGPNVTLMVPNRARPAAPKVLYAVPSFGWDPRRPRRPLAPGRARPRSTTSMVTRPCSPLTRTVARVGPAWRTTLVSDYCTMR